ncbi:hypothetical protein C1701_16715 [Actinoalloteichus sp. AHMU CJ021]|nr:hypothetical protein C1701_16715 [Actinoalloteichus sp. AHMU CJ021]
MHRSSAVHSIPEGQDEPKKEGFEVILPSNWTGHGDRMEAYEAENDAAREVMQTYQNETNNVLMSVPSFEEVPSTTYSAKGTTNPESIGNGIPGGAPSVPSVGGSGGGGGGGYGGGTPGGGMNWNGTGGGPGTRWPPGSGGIGRWRGSWRRRRRTGRCWWCWTTSTVRVRKRSACCPHW